MSRIKSKNTGIELKMQEILKALKCRYTMHPKMYGNPDFIIRGKRIAIFCDGDFWHGYRYLEKKRLPKKFWRDKIETNMKRDRKITRKLRGENW